MKDEDPDEDIEEKARRMHWQEVRENQKKEAAIREIEAETRIRNRKKRDRQAEIDYERSMKETRVANWKKDARRIK